MSTLEMVEYYKLQGYSQVLITRIITKWGPVNSKLQMLRRQETSFNPWLDAKKKLNSEIPEDWEFQVERPGPNNVFRVKKKKDK